MKKILTISIILIIGVYLYITYAYFYNFLGQKHLIPPAHPEKIIIGNLNRETLKYIALGDSLTAGTGVSNYKSSYPYQIALKIPSKKVELVNLALPGAVSKEVLINQIPQVQNLQPNVITLLIGVNDIHNRVPTKEFENNLTQSIKTLKQTNAKIYLLSIPYLGSDKITFFPYNLLLNFKTKQFNNIIRKIATEFNVGFVDLYSIEKPEDFYSVDQFHPSASGYKTWAEVINVN